MLLISVSIFAIHKRCDPASWNNPSENIGKCGICRVPTSKEHRSWRESRSRFGASLRYRGWEDYARFGQLTRELYSVQKGGLPPRQVEMCFFDFGTMPQSAGNGYQRKCSCEVSNHLNIHGNYVSIDRTRRNLHLLAAQ